MTRLAGAPPEGRGGAGARAGLGARITLSGATDVSGQILGADNVSLSGSSITAAAIVSGVDFDATAAAGGAIVNNSDANASPLTISHSTFANNQALGGSGGTTDRGGDGAGGALWNNVNGVARVAGATLVVDHSTFTGNLARGGQRGVAGFG